MQSSLSPEALTITVGDGSGGTPSTLSTEDIAILRGTGRILARIAERIGQPLTLTVWPAGQARTDA